VEGSEMSEETKEPSAIDALIRPPKLDLGDLTCGIAIGHMRERADNVALLRARAEELRALAKALGKAPAWAVDRAEELEAMADRIEGGEDE
jgi:hypothetical protein